MLLLLNTDTGMDGGSGDGECEGMTIDGDEYMGNDVDVDEGKEGMVDDECKDGAGSAGISDAECEDADIGTVKGLGVD